MTRQEIERGVQMQTQFTWDYWKGLSESEKARLRDNSGLIRCLIGLEGERIEVTYPDGDKKRFYVGKSTGWKPCHLEIARRDSSSGGPVWWPEGTTFRKLGMRRS